MLFVNHRKDLKITDYVDSPCGLLTELHWAESFRSIDVDYHDNIMMFGGGMFVRSIPMYCKVSVLSDIMMVYRQIAN